MFEIWFTCLYIISYPILIYCVRKCHTCTILSESWFGLQFNWWHRHPIAHRQTDRQTNLCIALPLHTCVVDWCFTSIALYSMKVGLSVCYRMWNYLPNWRPNGFLPNSWLKHPLCHLAVLFYLDIHTVRICVTARNFRTLSLFCISKQMCTLATSILKTAVEVQQY